MREMVFAVRDEMAGAYPELKESADRVARVVEAEERQFARVLEIGARQLQSAMQDGTLSGDKAFHLYETFGLPLDFMVDAAHDAGIHFDLDGFEKARAEEQARARASWKGGSKQSASPAFRELPKTAFEGYRQLKVERPRFSPLLRMVLVCRARNRAMLSKWCSITPASMPTLAARLATLDGFTPTITTLSSPM